MCLTTFLSSHIYPYYKTTWLDIGDLCVQIMKCHKIIDNEVYNTVVIKNLIVEGKSGRGLFKRFYRKLCKLLIEYGFQCLIFECVINSRLEKRLIRQGYSVFSDPIRGDYYKLLH